MLDLLVRKILGSFRETLEVSNKIEQLGEQKREVRKVRKRVKRRRMREEEDIVTSKENEGGELEEKGLDGKKKKERRRNAQTLCSLSGPRTSIATRTISVSSPISTSFRNTDS